MKRILLVISCFISLGVFAQQEQQYTQYMVNPYVLNPALGGTEDYTDVKLGYRTQWVNFGRDASGPVTYYVSAHGTLGKSFRQYHHRGEHGYWHGVGGYIYKDEAGPISISTFSLNYAFNTAITRKIRLSTGVFAGMKQIRVNRDWWNFTDNKANSDHDYSDPYLSSNDFSKLVPDLSVGMWMYTKDWFVGVSAYQLLQNNLSLEGLQTIDEQGTGKLKTHLFVMGGLKLPMTEKISVIPSFALKAVTPTPLSIDLNAKVAYDDLWFVGVNWRVQDSFAPLAGVVINKIFEVSYSYDHTTTKELRQNSSGTHEVIVGARIRHGHHIDCPSKFW